MISSPISRPVGSVRKPCSGVQPILDLFPSCWHICWVSTVPCRAEICLVALLLYRPWVWSRGMPYRHPAHLTWLQWNSLHGVHPVTHHWDLNLSFFRGNKNIYLCAVLSQIPATRALNNCPQTSVLSSFSVPRIFSSFPSLPSQFENCAFFVSIWFFFYFHFVGGSKVSENMNACWSQPRWHRKSKQPRSLGSRECVSLTAAAKSQILVWVTSSALPTCTCVKSYSTLWPCSFCWIRPIGFLINVYSIIPFVCCLPHLHFPSKAVFWPLCCPRVQSTAMSPGQCNYPCRHFQGVFIITALHRSHFMRTSWFQSTN